MKKRKRGAPRRKSDALLQLELKTVKEDLKACSQRVARMERSLKALTSDVDHLRDKIRH